MSTKRAPSLVSRAELARRAGVSRPAITKACKGKLAPACVEDRVDAAHPAAVAYLASKAPKGSPKKKAPAQKKAPKKKGPKKKAPAKNKAAKSKAPRPPTRDAPVQVSLPRTGSDEELDSVEPYASMSLRDLIAEFGSRRAFKDYLEALKKIEDIRKTRLDNDQTEGTLIARELVKGHILGYIDSAQRRLLTDTPKTIASRVYARARADEPIEVAVEEVKKLIQDQLRPLKGTATRNLRSNTAP